jgi:hypothetical protein
MSNGQPGGGKEDNKEPMDQSASGVDQEPRRSTRQSTTNSGSGKAAAAGEAETDMSAGAAGSGGSEEDGAPGSGKKKGKAAPKVKCVDLPVDMALKQLSALELKQFQEQEQQLMNQDRREMEKVDAKNSLEEYIYEMRDKLVDSLQPFVSEKDANEFKKLLDCSEEWLYDEGEDVPTDQYIDRKADLAKLGDPVMERYLEAQDRPRAFDDLGRSIQMARKIYDSWMNKDPAYDHLERQDMDKVLKAMEDTQAWFDKNINAQQRRPLTEPPVVLVTQIFQTKTTFENIVSPILNKAKPKPPPPPPPPAAEPQAASGTAAELNPGGAATTDQRSGGPQAASSRAADLNMEVD